MHRLNMAVFDVADPTRALQLGAFVSMISASLLRPTQSCKLNRKVLKVSTEFQESASFGETYAVNVVSRGQNKSGSRVDEHLFIMHQFDPAAFNPIWWLSALDVHLDDVKLPQQPYTAKDGPFSGQQAYSFVEMAAKGMTDSKPEHHTSLLQPVNLVRNSLSLAGFQCFPKQMTSHSLALPTSLHSFCCCPPCNVLGARDQMQTNWQMRCCASY